MASHPGAPRDHVDADGVRTVGTSAVHTVIRLALVSMGIVVLSVIAALIGLRVVAGGRAEPPAPRPIDIVAAPPAAVPTGSPRPAEPRASSPAPATSATPGRAVPRPPPSAPDPPEKEDEPFTIGDPKEQTGMKVFPPLGTKPIKRGIVVPDNFQLPPGYVRHYQATDDGERLPAILMFSPDYEWVDAQGKPLALPPDRVVPPELAPPGLPIRMLEVPAPKAAPDEAP